jgi:hypothetical protein
VRRSEVKLDGSAPRTGRNCPATSHRAEARNRAGAGPSQESAVWALLRGTPGCTAKEYARGPDWIAYPALSVDYHTRLCQIRKRLTDLKNKGLAVQSRYTTDLEPEVRWYVAHAAP